MTDATLPTAPEKKPASFLAARQPKHILLFILALAVLIALVYSLASNPRRKTPLTLVSANSQLYLETSDSPRLFKALADFPLWTRERRASANEPWNHILGALASRIGTQVHALGANLPLAWLASSRQAALALTGKDSGATGELAWVIFLDVPNPGQVLQELPGLLGITAVPDSEGEENILSLTGSDKGSLCLGVAGEWLLVASDPDPVRFALAASPATPSLAGSGVVPDWRSGDSLRGFVHPLLGSRAVWPSASGFDPAARISFIARHLGGGEVDLHLEVREVLGSPIFWLWQLLKQILSITAILCLVLTAAILALMLGWGSWLKYLAQRAGIYNAPSPLAVTPSPAFQEDSALPGENVLTPTPPSSLEETAKPRQKRRAPSTRSVEEKIRPQRPRPRKKSSGQGDREA
ncbi:MAG: hypothetical protein LBU79_05225 [Planctomycetota bacterium]|jgi:hypothetical protein|nr:hypothetical protein [Planctomycetota bacterium]